MASTEPEQHDRDFMQRALQLASETVALATPNPQVGCVIVRDGKILGEGAHLYDNYDHAEIVALKQAASRGHSVAGATAYVTLEPCSHHGRTGPCADALISAGISRVVVATTDPNPMVSGAGIGKLRTAGVEVLVGVLQQQARTLNDAFAHFIRTRTPFVTLKAALSADAKLAPSTTSRVPGQTYWLTGAEARNDVHRLRHASDAILTGIGTVLADNPQLTDRSGHPRRRPLLRIVLDTYLRIPLSSHLVSSAKRDLLVFSGSTAPDTKRNQLLNAGVEIETITEHDGRLSLPTILARLGERGILSLLLEGGCSINGAFLARDLVDKVILFYSRQTLGAEAIPFAEGFSSPSEIESSLFNVSRDVLGEDTRVTGYLRDPWPTPSSAD
ncbi:bifunctional diaminohydroxyphosphoribosylaminopyrimidine deaminase/5-amino-6-(5-phosphoribosylamino)uracil reductase RibD [Edaphobacter sp. HDX4]|uniref:bifunctional diaminohydroxyphosphoribosylaminopyrimidine deaminase/5-amino-6-(5-phosphoribosylamino)uracil reductase RibD n=1 Tax=Edaphobacter sp. HDX4 TaxID=2794064 RepID=UPI002FE560CC